MTRTKAKRNGKQATPANGSIPVVGIGASAGGIDALQSFLPAIPPKCGIAFVVVQHLDPERDSILSKLLARVTEIPVKEVSDDMVIEADHVYVIPPNASLMIAEDRLRLSKPVVARVHRTPIDGFFTSLADERGENAACVILSGTGSDGTVGLRAIKEKGGFTIAQAGAEYDGMMRSAVGTGLVDFVLPVDKIPAKLCDYFRHLVDINSRKGPDGVRQEAVDYVAQICALLRARTGHDFSGYKDKTVARRIQRRMQVLQIHEIADFVARLRKDPQVLDALLQDLLIGVTNFFRDPKAFQALEHQVIPRLFEGKGPDDTVRVWVPGCSTGEEAYSIAILLREQMPRNQGAPKLQIFASDIDEHALHTARIGRFPANAVKDVPAALLSRHFVREDGTYRVNSDLREICLFSAHNLLRDAPFSKLDLISCRNLLIYLAPELQNRLIPLFHYALQNSGYLFLGTSENVTRHSRLFSTVDKNSRIFQRRPQADRRLPEFPLTAPDESRVKPNFLHRNLPQESLQSLAEKQILERYAPAYVVINREGDLLHASAGTGKYLELAPGIPKTDIFSMARRGLRADLRAVVHRAWNSGQAAVQPNVVVGTNGGRQTIELIVQPTGSAREKDQDQMFMVIFRDLGGIKPVPDAANDTVEDTENAGLHQLEAELRSTKERLQTMTEELESSNEELKSGNEELSSMNEELQSANEELETSKEELQSINEELQTVNSELNSRVDELSRANSDIANLLESTQIATVFLDRNLTVKSFTPAAKDVFRLVESDTGRPITHVRARFGSDTVHEDAERVLRTLSTIERQVASTYNDARFIMRMMPYRTVDNVIAGVVITFVDITKNAAAEARINELTRDLKNRLQSIETILELLPVGVLIHEDSRIDTVRVNGHGANLLGERDQGKGLRVLTTSFDLVENGKLLKNEEQPLQRASGSGEHVQKFEGELQRADGSRTTVVMAATPLVDVDGQVRGAIATISDVSERKLAEEHQKALVHELQHRVKNIIAMIGALAHRMLHEDVTLKEFSDAFLGRLRAMARTHELLARSNWTGVDLKTLVEATLQPYASDSNVRVEGPSVMLEASVAATAGMVFYELATNAAKYGALSNDKGQVNVEWRSRHQSPVTGIHCVWTESGGPSVAASPDQGFGTNFIKRSVEFELNGTAAFDFRPTGLVCTLDFSSHPNTDAGEGRDARDEADLKHH